MKITLLSSQTRNKMNLTKMSKYLKISRSSLMRAKRRNERLEDPNRNELWEFSGRVP